MAIKNKNLMILFLAILILCLVLASCSKPECSTSSDCGSAPCKSSKCDNGKCVSTVQRNCCGNGIKDSMENGRTGNKCTCPQDYGKCDGKPKIKVNYRDQDATYVHYLCNSNSECALGVDRKDPQNVLDSIAQGFFKSDAIIKFNKPFDVNSDVFELRLTLQDLQKEVVVPIKFTHLKILYTSGSARNEQLIAESSISNSLSNIGDETLIKQNLNLGYNPQDVEEQGSVRYILDYTYSKNAPNGKNLDGSQKYVEEVARQSFSSPSKSVFFFKPK